MRQRFRADFCSRRPGRCHHAIHHGQRPVGYPREQADENNRHLYLRRFAHHLVCRHHADKHQNWHNGSHRNNGEHECTEAKQRHDKHRHTRCQRVADTRTHRFPARVSNVHRDRERVPHQAAERGGKAVGEHHFTGVVLITRCVGTLNVFQVKNVVRQPQRNCRCQVRQRVRQALQEAINMNRWRVKAE